MPAAAHVQLVGNEAAAPERGEALTPPCYTSARRPPPLLCATDFEPSRSRVDGHRILPLTLATERARAHADVHVPLRRLPLSHHLVLAEPTHVKLKSKQEEIFEVEKDVACRSVTVKNKEEGADMPVPLPMVDSKILIKVIEYCKYHYKAEQDFPDDEKSMGQGLRQGG